VASAEDLRRAQDEVKNVYVSLAVEQYIVDILNHTRQHPEVSLGGSPRGGLSLYRASQARAALLGRDHVLPDDVKNMTISVLAHRLILKPGAQLRKLSEEDLLSEILQELPVPGIEQLVQSPERAD
jgi:MoxR-like ATPase